MKKILLLFVFLSVICVPLTSCAEVKNFYMKNGDLLPHYRVQFRGSEGKINLTGTAIAVTMVDSDGNTIIGGTSVTITDATNGEAEYRWNSGDTDVAGNYYLEFTITDVYGREYTLPSRFRAKVIIVNRY